jgi:hypothetical protein
MSLSSSFVTYRPAGAGQKSRTARFDLEQIPDPKIWLEQAIGHMAHFELLRSGSTPAMTDEETKIQDTRERLASTADRLRPAISSLLAVPREQLRRFSARHERANPIAMGPDTLCDTSNSLALA